MLTTITNRLRSLKDQAFYLVTLILPFSYFRRIICTQECRNVKKIISDYSMKKILLSVRRKIREAKGRFFIMPTKFVKNFKDLKIPLSSSGPGTTAKVTKVRYKTKYLQLLVAYVSYWPHEYDFNLHRMYLMGFWSLIYRNLSCNIDDSILICREGSLGKGFGSWFLPRNGCCGSNKPS